MQNKKGSARKMECTDKEWQHCRVEKMGCHGCYYDEIEIGDYIRTKNGKIDKVINNNYYMQKYIECENGLYLKENIVKHSKKLIEQVQVGDILKIKEDNDICYIGLEKDTITVNYSDIKESIKNGECELLAILTKEQFNSNSFKVVQ